jgi:hypothetical protein
MVRTLRVGAHLLFGAANPDCLAAYNLSGNGS